MKQKGELETLLNLTVHDVQNTDESIIENDIYEILSIYGDVEILKLIKEPYSEVYENNADILLKLATCSSILVDEDNNIPYLSFTLSENTVEQLCKEKGYDCTVRIVSENFEAA